MGGSEKSPEFNAHRAHYFTEMAVPPSSIISSYSSIIKDVKPSIGHSVSLMSLYVADSGS